MSYTVWEMVGLLIAIVGGFVNAVAAKPSNKRWGAVLILMGLLVVVLFYMRDFSALSRVQASK